MTTANDTEANRTSHYHEVNNNDLVQSVRPPQAHELLNQAQALLLNAKSSSIKLAPGGKSSLRNFSSNSTDNQKEQSSNEAYQATNETSTNVEGSQYIDAHHECSPKEAYATAKSQSSTSFASLKPPQRDSMSSFIKTLEPNSSFFYKKPRAVTPEWLFEECFQSEELTLNVLVIIQTHNSSEGGELQSLLFEEFAKHTEKNNDAEASEDLHLDRLYSLVNRADDIKKFVTKEKVLTVASSNTDEKKPGATETRPKPLLVSFKANPANQHDASTARMSQVGEDVFEGSKPNEDLSRKKYPYHRVILILGATFVCVMAISSGLVWLFRSSQNSNTSTGTETEDLNANLSNKTNFPTEGVLPFSYPSTSSVPTRVSSMPSTSIVPSDPMLRSRDPTRAPSTFPSVAPATPPPAKPPCTPLGDSCDGRIHCCKKLGFTPVCSINDQTESTCVLFKPSTPPSISALPSPDHSVVPSTFPSRELTIYPSIVPSTSNRPTKHCASEEEPCNGTIPCCENSIGNRRSLTCSANNSAQSICVMKKDDAPAQGLLRSNINYI